MAGCWSISPTYQPLAHDMQLRRKLRQDPHSSLSNLDTVAVKKILLLEEHNLLAVAHQRSTYWSEIHIFSSSRSENIFCPLFYLLLLYPFRIWHHPLFAYILILYFSFKFFLSFCFIFSHIFSSFYLPLFHFIFSSTFFLFQTLMMKLAGPTPVQEKLLGCSSSWVHQNARQRRLCRWWCYACWQECGNFADKS